VKKLYYYNTQIGKLGIAEEHGLVTNICFASMRQPLDATVIRTETLDYAFSQIIDYLDGKINEFDIPVNPAGTPFQQQVWCELLKIPYGETKSYKDVAESLGNPKAFRAVGNANNKNPIPIIIPCHRVILSDNNNGGYAGGTEIKELLLSLEKKNAKKFY